jgi:hypothetical protein
MQTAAQMDLRLKPNNSSVAASTRIRCEGQEWAVPHVWGWNPLAEQQKCEQQESGERIDKKWAIANKYLSQNWWRIYQLTGNNQRKGQ